MSTREGMRPADIRDARKMNLYPSVTTIIALLDKPGLDSWRVEQGIKAARDDIFARDRLEEDAGDFWVKEVAKASEEYVNWTADFGTELHQGVSHYVRGIPHIGRIEVDVVLQPFCDWLSEHFVAEQTERTFVNPTLGYAGQLDLLGVYDGQRCITDIKTQDFIDVQKAQFHEEYPLQLAGYALGVEEPELPRFSFVVSRSTPGLVAVKQWRDTERDNECWLKLLALWKVWKGYDVGTNKEER